MARLLNIKFIRILVAISFLVMSFPINPTPVYAAGPYAINGAISPANSVVSVKFNDGTRDWPGVIAGDGLSYSITGFADNASGAVTAVSAAGYTVSPVSGYTGLLVLTALQNLNFTGIPITYTISGNAGAAGANIDFTDGTTVTADDHGVYSITVPNNWSGTVTPSLAGYTFTPASQDFTNVQSDLPQDFAAVINTYIISGNAGAANATIDFSGGTLVAADGTGAYSISVPYDWSGMVTPSLAGYIFAPAAQDFSNVQADQPFDFSAAVATYTITGNTGVASANVDFTGGSTVLTDGSGVYSITVPYDWSGTVTPSLAGFNFTPASQDFANVQANQTYDFVPSALTYTISGYTGVALANIDFTGGSTVKTDGTGAYSITVPYNWVGTVVPSLAGYTFTPASQDFANVLENKALDFVAAPVMYSISGNVGIASASIAFTGGMPVTADASGAYSITVPYNWSGAVVPSLAGYTFTPTSQDFANVSENKALNFTAAVPATNTPVATNTSVATNTATLAPTSTMTVTVAARQISRLAAAAAAAPIVGAGTYDDSSSNVLYTGNWRLINSFGPLYRTDHTTNATGTTVSLSFNGTRVDYIYPTYYNRGHVRISIDGTPVTDLSLYSRRMAWQRKWSSPTLASGNHTITVTRLDGYVDLDAFVVTNSTSGSTLPTNTATSIPAATQTAAPSFTPTNIVIKTATPTAVPSYTPTKTATKIATQTAVSSLTPTKTATKTTAPTAVSSFTPTKTATKTATPTAVTSFTPTVTKTATATPTTVPSGTGKTVFNASFESGNFSYFDGYNGEIFGKGIGYSEKIVTSPAIGNYSAALTIGSGSSTSAYLFTYNVPSTPLGIYSADYYIPSNIVPADWWNVWQWKSVDESYSKPVIALNLLEDGGELRVFMFYVPGGNPANADQMFAETNPIPFPRDRWVHITGKYMSKSDNTGYVEIYQDGVKIFEKSNIMTKPGNKDILWSINSYADTIAPNPATIYIDNMNIAESN